MFLIQSVVAGEQWHYIAAQTPLENHQNEMWDMVWRNRTSIIVLITKEIVSDKGNRSLRDLAALRL